MLLRWGRFAAVFVNGTKITRTKGIATTDEADDQKLELRELGCAVHLPGIADFSLSFQKLNDGGASYTLLREAYDDRDQELVVLLVEDTRLCTSRAIRFTGCCLKFTQQHPEDGPSLTEVTLANTGLTAETGPTRTTWTNPNQMTCIS